MLRKIISGITAGLLIGIGGTVFLACENKVVGAVAFTIGLLSICHYGLSLYTGKIGYMFAKHDGEAWAVLIWGLLGTLIGALVTGLLIREALPAIGDKAAALETAKLEQTALQTLIRASFCGILVYVAVNLFRDKKTVLGILIGIPVFILSGFEHSIADMFYFFAGGNFSLPVWGFLGLAVLGNSVGALVFDRLLHYSQ